jgi:hypothetical protein
MTPPARFYFLENPSMASRKTILACVAAAALVATVPARAAETMKGTLADEMCAKRHVADEKGVVSEKSQACVKKCLGEGKAVVFISGDKLYKIANQDFKELKAHAGHEVMLTGDVKDDTVTITKIEMPKK